jgi:tight adherence protein B
VTPLQSEYGLAPLTEYLRYGAPTLLTLAMFLGAYGASADDGGPVMRAYLSYTGWLDRQFRLLFIFYPARRVVLIQVVVLYLVLTLQALIGIPYWYVLVPLCIFGPSLWVKNQRKRRLLAIEEQLDGFVLSLANALKTTPSVGSAFQSLVTVVRPPFSQEVDLAVKEMKVGSSLDQALLHMASRMGSRQVDSALSAILIGRTVGGNLPKVLEGTAQSLREMRRLEGVVRTKTAEAKAQLVVIAALPFGLIYAAEKISPGYFLPLTQSFLGYTIIVICIIAWIGAIIIARTMLRVDI